MKIRQLLSCLVVCLLLCGGGAIIASAEGQEKSTPSFASASTGQDVYQSSAYAPMLKKLAELEASSGGRLGVTLLDTAGNMLVAYRSTEIFPMCSTFKVVLVAAVLKQSESAPDLLEQRITFAKGDLMSWSPITKEHTSEGMSVAALCAAAITHSDNTAANLLLKLVGGPQGLTAFARSMGDVNFRVDRYEPELNEALPGDERDTTTPEAMARSLRALTLEGELAPSQREMLLNWLEGNTTGGDGIRAGIPKDWLSADKTGSGSYGTTNHIAILWPPHCEPIILCIYFTQKKSDTPPRKDIIAAVASCLRTYP